MVVSENVAVSGAGVPIGARKSTTPQTEPTSEHGRCPECDGRLIDQAKRGETACEECGLVVSEQHVDLGQEWRNFGDTNEPVRRAGSPLTVTMHDKGLATRIGWDNTDAYGNSIPPRKLNQVRRMRMWQRRSEAKTTSAENRRHGFGEIDRMRSALGLPNDAHEMACVIFRRAQEEGLLVGVSVESVATAALYHSVRVLGFPRSLSEFIEVSRVGRSIITTALSNITQGLSLKRPPQDPASYLPKLASDLEVPNSVRDHAAELVEAATEEALHIGKNPIGFAGAALWLAGTREDEYSLTQSAVAEKARCSRQTIRLRADDLRASL